MGLSGDTASFGVTHASLSNRSLSLPWKNLHSLPIEESLSSIPVNNSLSHSCEELYLRSYEEPLTHNFVRKPSPKLLWVTLHLGYSEELLIHTSVRNPSAVLLWGTTLLSLPLQCWEYNVYHYHTWLFPLTLKRYNMCPEVRLLSMGWGSRKVTVCRKGDILNSNTHCISAEKEDEGVQLQQAVL